MYNYQVKVPVVIRTPMGGGRGYGPTHSQSLEKIFLGIPGLKVVAPSHFHNVGEVLKHAVMDDDPVLFIEHKLLYPQKLVISADGSLDVEIVGPENGYSVSVVRNFDHGNPDLLVFTYGGMSRLLDALMRKLKTEEIKIVTVLPSLISSPCFDALAEMVRLAGKVLVVEEGPGSFGWGAEIAAQLYQSFGHFLQKPIRRITASNSVVPAARHLENVVLPNEQVLEQTIEDLLV